MKRLFETETLQEDWFLKLSPDYQRFYLFAYFNASPCGLWRPKTSIFRDVYMKKQRAIGLKAFLDKVNRDNDGKFYERIYISPVGNWLILEVFYNSLGHTFKPNVVQHRSALKDFVKNQIPLEIVSDFAWNVEKKDISRVKSLVLELSVNQSFNFQPLGNRLARGWEGVGKGSDTDIHTNKLFKEKEEEKENETAKKPTADVPGATHKAGEKLVDIALLKDILLADRGYVETIKRRYAMIEAHIEAWMVNFNDFLKFDSGTHRRYESDYRRHFANWVSSYAGSDPDEYMLLPLKKEKRQKEKQAEEFTKGKIRPTSVRQRRYDRKPPKDDDIKAKVKNLAFKGSGFDDPKYDKYKEDKP